MPDSPVGRPAAANAAVTDKPLHQRPERPEFWDHRFDRGTTPWDAGSVPADLIDFFNRGAAGLSVRGPLTVLIPGCGSAWEAAWFDEAGHRVTALDFSPAAITAARAVLADRAPGFAGELVCGDFFTHRPAAPDLIYERAFLAALPRRLWSDYAARMAALVPPGGLLAGFFFVSDEPKGPPFGLAEGQLEGLLEPTFERLEDHAVLKVRSIPVFSGRERWQVWRRKAD